MPGDPDILLVMTDQQRADFTRGAGFPLDTMPFVDSLADAGTTFPGAYTVSPACVPARTSLLTGRFPSAHRVRQNSLARAATYHEDLLDVLRAAGYRLHFAGKPHMYPGPDDFDDFRGPYMHTGGPEDPDRVHEAAFDRWLHELDHSVSHEPTPFPLEAQLPYRIVSEALDSLDGAPADDPLLMWVSFPEPHNPYQVPEPYFSLFPEQDIPQRRVGPGGAEAKGGMYRWLRRLIESKRPGYDQEWRRYRANYCGMLRLVDDQIRRLHEGVTGRRGRDTVVIFLSDHGDYAADYGLQRKGAGMPECLMRIPMVVSGAGVAEQRRDELVSIADVMPTLCEIAGRPIPAGVQGRSLLPLLGGGAHGLAEFDSIYAESGYGGQMYGPDEHPPLHFPYEGARFDELNTVTQSGQTIMVRRGAHKLLFDSAGRGELYDLDDDPAELVNRYDDPAWAGVRHELMAELLRWRLQLTDTLPQGNYTPKAGTHNWYRSTCPDTNTDADREPDADSSVRAPA